MVYLDRGRRSKVGCPCCCCCGGGGGCGRVSDGRGRVFRSDLGAHDITKGVLKWWRKERRLHAGWNFGAKEEKNKERESREGTKRAAEEVGKEENGKEKEKEKKKRDREGKRGTFGRRRE